MAVCHFIIENQYPSLTEAALVYAPVISYMSEWFVQRRGLANGILVAGTSSSSKAPTP